MSSRPAKARRESRAAHPRNEEAFWDALCRRDSSADGEFIYSVLTTGVYCRPSCAARLPRRENVRFFATSAEAERAGFRACRRCRPNEPALAERHAAVVAKACRMIVDADEPPSLEELAKLSGLSRFHFHRLFKTLTGVTPKAYAAAHRAQRASRNLSESATVTQAIYDAGFSSSSRFYETSTQRLGMTPKQLRAGGGGVDIRFAVGETSLGTILVAATGKGICAIQFSDDPETLVRELQDRFPNARLIGDDPDFEQVVAKVVGLIEAPRNGIDLPLDLRGTAFQQQIWQALRDIEPSSTVSYAEIAKRIGRPTAIRAVAQACSANEIAVAIPCHRVVRKDSALAGYRWGIERKRALLERERTS